MARSRAELVAEIRLGLPVNVIDKLTQELAISQQALLQIIALPTATLTRRRTQICQIYHLINSHHML